eukprot:scaffold3523_cov194-Alexandrium_tamarense.AAC.1
MDGPQVKWTPGDVFASNPSTFMTYHVMTAGYDAFTPLGAAAGAALYGLRFRSLPSVYAMMGFTGLIAGGIGMAVGLGGMQQKAQLGEKASPPWNEEGIQQRVDGISHNFKVRVLDLSVWSGAGLGLVTAIVAGGPTRLRLSSGVLGVLQAVSLGSALGSLSAFGCIYATAPKDVGDDED